MTGGVPAEPVIEAQAQCLWAFHNPWRQNIIATQNQKLCSAVLPACARCSQVLVMDPAQSSTGVRTTSRIFTMSTVSDRSAASYLLNAHTQIHSISICLLLRVWQHMYAYIYLYTHMTHMYIHVPVYIYIYLMIIYIYIYIHIHMRVCIYIYTYYTDPAQYFYIRTVSSSILYITSITSMPSTEINCD